MEITKKKIWGIASVFVLSLCTTDLQSAPAELETGNANSATIYAEPHYSDLNTFDINTSTEGVETFSKDDTSSYLRKDAGAIGSTFDDSNSITAELNLETNLEPLLPNFEYSLHIKNQEENPYCYGNVIKHHFSKRFYNKCHRENWKTDQNNERASKAHKAEKKCFDIYDPNLKANQPKFQKCIEEAFNTPEVVENADVMEKPQPLQPDVMTSENDSTSADMDVVADESLSPSQVVPEPIAEAPKKTFADAFRDELAKYSMIEEEGAQHIHGILVTIGNPVPDPKTDPTYIKYVYKVQAKVFAQNAKNIYISLGHLMQEFARKYNADSLSDQEIVAYRNNVNTLIKRFEDMHKTATTFFNKIR